VILVLNSLALVLLIGVLDYWTGHEMSFAIFYLVPVSFAAWFVGRYAGLTVSLVSGAVWEVSNVLAGQTFSSPLFYAWNTTSRIVVFSLMAILLCKLHAALEHERKLSRIDPLTGVLNRRAFQEEFARELRRAQRYELPLTLAFIDLDDFKAMNDQFGHSAGDALLCTVAATIDRVIRDTDIAARLGGDEFAILFTNTDSVGAPKGLTKVHTYLQRVAMRMGCMAS
jgi:diguanylate cyclase (GGDEF)-like protein